MPIPSVITDLSATAASNSPSGSDSPIDGDNFLRALSAFIRQNYDTLTATIAAGLTAAQLASTSTAAPGASLIGYLPSGTSAQGRTVQSRLNDLVSVFNYMTPAQIADVRAGTLLVDVTAEIQAAITDVGNGSLFFPDGAYKISALLTSALNATPVLWGNGYAKCQIFQYSATLGCIKFNSVNPGGGIRGMTLASSTGGAVPGSSGVGLHMLACGNNFIVRDLLITNFDTGMRVEGSNGEHVENVTIRYFTNFGIDLPAAADQLEGRYKDVQISNIGFSTPNASIGLSIKGSGGHFFKDFDILACGQSVVIAPSGGHSVTYCSFYDVLADTSINDGWVIDGTNGTVVGCEMDGCWGAFSTNGSGLVTKGSGLISLQWVGGRLRENGTYGWDHQGGTNVSVTNAHIAQNSKLTTLTYYGVRVAANVGDWQLLNCMVGNFGSGLGTQQLHGISVAAGTSANFQICNNIFTNPGSGGLNVVNGSTVSSWVVQGNLPIQTNAVNQNRSMVFSGASVGTVAAGVTRYLGSAGQQAAEGDSYFVSGRPCVATQFIAQVDTAPGAAQSFTYTVRLNSTNTAMTGVITGAASFQVVLQIPFSISAADTVSIQLTTTAGAALARHRWVLNTDY